MGRLSDTADVKIVTHISALRHVLLLTLKFFGILDLQYFSIQYFVQIRTDECVFKL